LAKNKYHRKKKVSLCNKGRYKTITIKKFAFRFWALHITLSVALITMVFADILWGKQIDWKSALLGLFFLYISPLIIQHITFDRSKFYLPFVVKKVKVDTHNKQFNRDK